MLGLGGRGRRGALRHRPFRWLVAGVGVSGLGSAMAPVALAFAVLDLGGSATQLGLVVAAFSAAEVATLLFGGVLGDRVPRQLLMQGSALATAVTQAVVATVLISGSGSLLFLTLMGVVNGCLGALAQPASAAMTRSTVPSGDLGDAVVVRGLVSQTSYAVGFALSGVVVAFAGPGWALAVDSVSYVLAAACFAAITVEKRVEVAVGDAAGDAVEEVGATRGSMRADLAEGAREVMRHTWLWLLIAQALAYHLCFGGVQGVLGPVVVAERWDERAWGAALAALMAGFVVGGLIATRWRPRRLLLPSMVMLALTSAFPLAIAVAEHLPLLLLGALVHGAGLQLFSVSWDLAIQQEVPEALLSRVYSFDMVGSFVARPLGLALTGPVAALVGVRTWLLVVAAVLAVTSLLALASSSVRGLTRRIEPVAGPADATVTG